MKKKFDIKSTLGMPNRQLTPEQIDLAALKIHAKPETTAAPASSAEPHTTKKVAEKPQKRPAPKPKPVAKKSVAPPLAVVSEPAEVYKTAPQSPKSVRRDAAPDKKVRLSVDVLPTVHKQLKLRAIQNDTDIMHYVEMLIERDLSKN